MKCRMRNKHNLAHTYKIIFFALLCYSGNIVAQQDMTRSERIKTLQLLKESDAELEKAVQVQTRFPKRSTIWNCLPFRLFWMR